jgi:succinate-semialdehyde dehydrogenase/glutarate-semialdehyde dehydrogenase
LIEQCAGTVKKLSLELGGNAPFIVFDDADIEMAVKGAIASKYRNAGQTCVCANRILVQDGVYDVFTKRLAETAGAMKVADEIEPGAVIGPLIDMKAVEKVEAHIADAVKKGAKVVTGGKRAAQGGSFFEPIVLTDVTTQNFWLGQPPPGHEFGYYAVPGLDAIRGGKGVTRAAGILG